MTSYYAVSERARVAASRLLTRTSLVALSCGLGMFAPGGAFAQTPKPAASVPAEAADSAAEIVVTGTRLANPDFKSPTPLTSLGSEALEARAAVTVANVLYELPSVQPTPSGNSTSQVGGNFVNLRGFGTGVSAASRTLVLVDGRRFVPTNNQGQVDLNVIPTALVERLDIVTGGASAAYGSDAVAGVVNVILKSKLEGFRGNIQDGISARGDAHSFAASLAWGTSFAEDRGQFMIAGDYSSLTDTPRQGDRAYSAQHTGFASDGTNIVPISGQTLGGYTDGGVLIAANGARLATTSPLYGRQFLSSTSSSPFNYGTLVAGNGNTQVGGDGSWFGDRLLLASPLDRKTVFARVSYEFSPAVKLWAEGSYSYSRTNADLYTNAVRAGNVEPYITENARVNNYDAAGTLLGTTPNLLIPADIRAILTANNITSVTVGRTAPDLGSLHTDSRVRTIRGAAGLEGTFGGSWHWDANFTHGETRFSTDLSNNIIEPNLAAALDVVYLNGVATCRINVPGQVASGLSLNASPGCVVANPFGPGSLASAKNYVTGTLGNVVDYVQDAAQVSLGGEPFSTWAGPVSFVVGAEWRKESVSQVVSPFSDLINGSLLPTGSFQQANPKSFAGGVTVKEAFGEIGIPLLRDMALGHSLDLNGAARITNYSTSGSVTTWKVGGTYSPVEGVLFRVVRSRDIRAANLFQLYGRSTGVANGLRLQNNTTANFALINVGNTALKPEVADTTSFGASISNLGFLPGLSISVDYYKIDLSGFVGQLTSQNILDFCFGSSRVGSTVAVADPTQCNAYVSGSGGVGLAALAGAAPYTLRSPQLNVGSLSTKGIDFEVTHRLPLSSISSNATGVFTTRFLATYVDELIYNTSGTAPVNRVGDISGAPKWRWTLSETYQNGPLTLTAQGRYTGPLDLDRSVTNNAQLPLNRVMPAAFYLNVGAAYKVIDQPGKKVEVYVNVNNLLDRDPPFTGPSFPAGSAVSQTSAVSASYTNIAWYDTIGRAYTAGIRFQF